MSHKIAERLKDYPPVAMALAPYTILGVMWFSILDVFFHQMAPRLGYLTVHRAVANDPPCGSPECDFSVFWPAGVLARSRQFKTIYNPELFSLWRQHHLVPAIDPLSWFYPPPALLPFLGLSRLSFEVAFAFWIAGFTILSIILLRAAALSWLVIIIAMLSPAALWNLELGQFGIIIGAILTSGLLLADKSPWRAGGILGLLVIKPQPGLLVPVAMLAALNWRAILGAAVVVALVLAVTTASLGFSVWRFYFSEGMAVSKSVLQAPPQTTGYEKFGVSAFWMLRSLGSGLPLSYAAQAVATLFAAGLAWRICRAENIGRIDRMALIVFLSLLATPYGYTDDMAAWSIALTALAEQRRWRIDLLDALFWLWPTLCPIVFTKTGILFTPVVIIVAVFRTLRRSGLLISLWPFNEAVLPRAT
jgi:hypothetical protein